jgi:thiamine biosynthesis lipoprotein
MTTERRVVVADRGRELGTSYELELLVPEGEEAPAWRALEAARAECHRLELILSEWRDDSEISHLNQQAWRQPVPVTDLVDRLLAGAMHVARATGGAFDFTWAPLGVLWDQAELRGRLPDEAELAEARRHIGFDKVSLQGGVVRFSSPGVRLGVASFAKGWIIDALFHVLRQAGFANVIVNIGGDLRTSGHDAQGGTQVFKVLDPYRPTHAAAELGIVEGALATSGNYFRQRQIGGRAYGHLFDPATGRPPEFDGSVTVLAADAAMADALATALFVMGPERGLELARRVPGLEVLYLTQTGPVATDGLRPRARFAVEGSFS